MHSSLQFYRKGQFSNILVKNYTSILLKIVYNYGQSCPIIPGFRLIHFVFLLAWLIKRLICSSQRSSTDNKTKKEKKVCL